MAKQNMLQTITDPIQAWANSATGGFAPAIAAGVALPIRKAMGQDVSYGQLKQGYEQQVAAAKDRAGVVGDVADAAGMFTAGAGVLKGAGMVAKGANKIPGVSKTAEFLASVAKGLPGAGKVASTAAKPLVRDLAAITAMGSAGATLNNPNSGLNKSISEALPAMSEAMAENGIPGAVGSALGSAAGIASGALTAPVAAVPDVIKQFSRGFQGKTAATDAAAAADPTAAAPGAPAAVSPAMKKYQQDLAQYEKFIGGMKGMTMPGLMEAMQALGQGPKSNAKPLQGTERAMQMYTNMAIQQADAIRAQFGEDSPEYATARANLMQQLIATKSPAAMQMLGLQEE